MTETGSHNMYMILYRPIGQCAHFDLYYAPISTERRIMQLQCTLHVCLSVPWDHR